MFQSDEGGEFYSTTRTAYFNTNGIHHQSSCPKNQNRMEKLKENIKGSPT